MIIVSMTDIVYRSKQDCNPVAVTQALKLPDSRREIEAEDFLIKVGEQGFSWSPAVFNAGYRDVDHWKEQQVFGLDFDNSDLEKQVTVQDVIARCIKYDVMPFGIYRTLSSETPNDKFRVVFKLPDIVNNSKVSKSIVVLLYYFFPESDPQCKEIARLYYGGKEVVYKNIDAELNIVKLFQGYKSFNQTQGTYADIQSAVERETENVTISQISSPNDVLEKYDANIETVEEAVARGVRDDDSISRLVTVGEDTYLFRFNERVIIPAVTTKTTNKSGNVEKKTQQEGKQFFGYQSKKKVLSALEKITPDNYENWYTVLWGLNNTYGDEAWEVALEWSRKGSSFKNDSDVHKKWSDSTQRGDISVGTIYHIAKKNGWEYKDEIISWFNTRYFISKYGQKTYVFTEQIDPVTGRVRLEYQDKKNFRDLMTVKKTKIEYGGRNKEIPAVDYWLDSEHVRTYIGGVHFDPSGTLPKNCYNWWTGWKYENGSYSVPTTKNSKIQMYMDHIFRNICSSDQLIFNYVISWMALAIQKPWIKAPVVLVLRSDDEGVGKGVFANTFGELFGENFSIMSHVDQVVGQFNSHLQRCLLLHSDEAEYGKQHHNILKNLITEEYINVNPKGIAAFQAKNYLHIIMSSNNDFVVPASIGSRRFCILDVQGENKKDTKYFTEMKRQMEDGGYKELFHHLKAIDISGFNIYEYPKTEQLNKQIIFTLDKEYKFLFEKLQEGLIDPLDNEWGSITSDVIYAEYTTWIRDKYGYSKYKLSKIEIGNLLKKMFGDHDGFVKRKIRKVVDEKLIFVMKYYLPPLNICRRLFEKFVGFEILWHEETQVEENLNHIDVPSKKSNIIKLNLPNSF